MFLQLWLKLFLYFINKAQICLEIMFVAPDFWRKQKSIIEPSFPFFHQLWWLESLLNLSSRSKRWLWFFFWINSRIHAAMKATRIQTSCSLALKNKGEQCSKRLNFIELLHKFLKSANKIWCCFHTRLFWARLSCFLSCEVDKLRPKGTLKFLHLERHRWDRHSKTRKKVM